MIDPDLLLEAYRTARDDLLAERTAAGHWIGELSSSALSTATAASAMSVVLREAGEEHPQAGRLGQLVAGAVDWLARSQNPDGGWGDTDKSLSNIATTMLVRAAFRLAGAAEGHAGQLARAERYVASQGGVPGLRRRYGKDKTFAVPILTNAALAGLVAWREVAPLPFEMACLPHWLLGAVRLPVVSYAIPALVAVGQARYFHRPPRNPITRLVRRLAIEKSLAVLRGMQPTGGGYLEAAPLTSFVVMGLASVGRVDHPVVTDGLRFLVDSVRPDGSWPIDTNLATWVTTLAINALAAEGDSQVRSARVSRPRRVGDGGSQPHEETFGPAGGSVGRPATTHGSVGRPATTEVCPSSCLDWLLSCQHRQVHPFTSAAPGGWGWTDLSGGVPDADDTPGALLALWALRESSPPEDAARINTAARLGVGWLLDLQNRDGGWPTFCRGWGAMPFDRSGSDLTAHALRALHAWRGVAAGWDRRTSPERIAGAIGRGLKHLAGQQRHDGSWVPLWFGNQHHADEENPVYGTARVLLAYRDLHEDRRREARRGLEWLASAQAGDGGWTSGGSGVSSVEETAVAVEGLVWAAGDPSLQPAISKGLRWLVRAVQSGRHRESAPIGFYFAKLWYYERLYPLIFTVSALGRAVRRVLPQGHLPPSPT